MNIKEVLAIYKQMMINFDHAESEESNIKHNATTKAPSDTIKFHNVLLSQQDRQKIHNAAREAHRFADDICAKKKLGTKKYKEEFRGIYSTVLRVELYRQFIVTGQDLNIVSLRQAVKLLADVSELFIQNEIIQFLTMNGLNNNNAIFLEITLRQVLDDFTNQNCSILKSTIPDVDKINKIKKAAFHFEFLAITKIQQYQIKYESDTSWGPFLKNLLLIITGIGALFTMYSLIYKGFTGHYAFFDNSYLKEIEVQEDECLVTAKHLNQYNKGFFNSSSQISSKPLEGTMAKPLVKITIEALWEQAHKAIERVDVIFRKGNEENVELFPRHYGIIYSSLDSIKTSNDLKNISDRLKQLENLVKPLNDEDELKADVTGLIYCMRNIINPIGNFYAQESDNKASTSFVI